MAGSFVRVVLGFAMSIVAVFALALTICLAAMSATAPRLLANALVMGGTFQPTPDQAFVNMAINDFIAPTLDPELNPAVTRDLYSYDWVTVTYPASGGITGGIGAPTVDQSVAIGVNNLESAIAEQPVDQPIVVFGFSQSTVVSMIEKARLAERQARGEAVPDVTFVGIGVGNRPHGGIATRLHGITIPFFEFTFNGPAPTDTGFTTIDIAREYDGLADFPLYPINLLADVNALFGVLFVHTRYDEVSLDPANPKYVVGTVRQQYGDTTYYQIPTPELPLFDPLRILGVPEAFIDLFEPVTKVLVDTGYGRTIPFGEPTPLRLIPRIDPATFTADLVAAVGSSLNSALRLIVPPSGAEVTEPRSEQAAASGAAQSEPTEVAAAAQDSGDRRQSIDETAVSADPDYTSAPAVASVPDGTGVDSGEMADIEIESSTDKESGSRAGRRDGRTPGVPGTPDQSKISGLSSHRIDAARDSEPRLGSADDAARDLGNASGDPGNGSRDLGNASGDRDDAPNPGDVSGGARESTESPAA